MSGPRLALPRSHKPSPRSAPPFAFTLSPKAGLSGSPNIAAVGFKTLLRIQEACEGEAGLAGDRPGAEPPLLLLLGLLVGFDLLLKEKKRSWEDWH